MLMVDETPKKVRRPRSYPDKRIVFDKTRKYSAAEVAGYFGHNVNWFYAHREELETLAGFPKPISPIGHLKYDGEVLEAWAKNPHQDPPGPAAAADPSYTTRLLESRKPHD
jgi:hypothetical protein